MNKNFEVLFNQIGQAGEGGGPLQADHSHNLKALDSLKEKNLVRLLESYSVTALTTMAQSRGLGDARLKKSSLVEQLARRFYGQAQIKHSLNSLSPTAREGLSRIKRAGGIVRLATWRVGMEARYGKAGTDTAQAELVGGMLAFYGMLFAHGVEFNTQKVNELNAAGLAGDNVVFWSYPKVLDQFQETALVAEPPLAAYSGSDKGRDKGKAPMPTQDANFESLLTDMIAFLRYIEAAGRLKVLVNTGDVGKRDFVKISELMTVKERIKPSEAKKLDDLGRVNFVWNLLTETGMVTLGGNYEQRWAEIKPENSEEFYTLPRYKQARLLTAAWLRGNFNDFRRIPTLNFYGTPQDMTDVPDRTRLTAARGQVLGLLENLVRAGRLESAQWFDFRALLAALRDRDPDMLVTRRSKGAYSYNYNYYNAPGYFGLEYYNGFDSKLKKPGPARPNQRSGQKGTLLRLSEDWELVEGEWLAELLAEPLAWLGLAEVSADEAARPVAFRLSELGLAVLTDQPSQAETEQARQLATAGAEAAKALLVQPNFDVMVLAPLHHMPLLRQIDRFASQTSTGDVAMFRISKESVLRGLRSGLSGSAILQILNDNSRVPVAQNIAASIGAWAQEFERLVLYMETTVLELPTAEMLERLLALAASESLLFRRLGPTFAQVAGDLTRLDEVMQQLYREGAGPKVGPKGKEGLPVYLDYKQQQPNSFAVEGDRLLHVQPHTGNPYLYYRLGQFADLENWNPSQMSATFRLSLEAGQRAQVQGLILEEVSEFLVTHLPTRKMGAFLMPQPLPPPLFLALKGWLGYYSPLQAEKAVTLQASQSTQLDDIFAQPEFAEALIGRAGPRTALVRESHFARLRDRLAALGMPVVAPEFDPAPVPALRSLPSPAQSQPEPAAVEEGEGQGEGSRKRGRKPKGAAAAALPPKPKETPAQRDRRLREEEEAAHEQMRPILLGSPVARGSRVVSLGGGGGGDGPSNPAEMYEMLQVLKALSSGELPLSELIGGDFDDDDGDDDDDFFEPPPRGRPRRRF